VTIACLIQQHPGDSYRANRCKLMLDMVRGVSRMEQGDDEGRGEPPRDRTELLAAITAQLRQALATDLRGAVTSPVNDPEGQAMVGAINEVLAAARAAVTHADAARSDCESLDRTLDEVEGRLAAEAVQQERTTRELAQQRAVLSHVVDSLPYCMFWRDRAGTYLGANKNKLRALGLASQDEIVGKTAYETGVSREEADYYLQVDKLVMDSGEPIFNLEETQRRPDGEHTLLVSKVPLRDEAGDVIGILGMYVDVTERRRIAVGPGGRAPDGAGDQPRPRPPE
jgi:PAS domain S-box-containing protein